MAGIKSKRTKAVECAMCHKMIPPDKRVNKHHLSYRNNIVVTLCYICHCIVHARLKFFNRYDKMGKDYSAFYMAKDILDLYKPVYAEIQEFVCGGFPDKTPAKKRNI